MATIVWVGIGRMGLPMAKHLVRTGHHVRGIEVDAKARDVAAEAGIELADDLPSAVRDADAVFTMLPTGKHVTEVMCGPDGVFAHVRRSAVVVDSSTIDIASVRDLHLEALRVGVMFLDAPVSGGTDGAAAGTLTFMVGGAPDALAIARPYLEAMSAAVVSTGGPGTGQAAKIVNNMIFGSCLAATCEGVLLAERLGLDHATVYEIVTRSSGDNWPLRRWYPAPGVVPAAPSSRGFAPGFTMNLLVKDLSLASAAAQDTATPTEVLHTTLGLFRAAAADSGELDCTALVLSLAGSDEIRAVRDSHGGVGRRIRA